MSTVKDLYFALTQRIDPYSKAGVALTSTTAGTTDGDRFTKEEKLEFYNDARFVLAGAIDRLYPPQKKAIVVSGNVVKASLTFTTGVAPKPAGFISHILMTDSTGATIAVLPTTLIDQTKDLETSTNRVVYDYGTNFTALTGTTNIPNASTYVLYYYGITTYAISDVTGGSTVESFNDQWHEIIIQLAEAMSREQGSQEVNALAEQLIAIKF